MRFAELAAVSDAVRSTSARNAKVALLAGALRELAPDEIEAGTAFLAGALLERQIGVGWASLRSVPPPAAGAVLEVADVAAAFARIGDMRGAGSVAARREALEALFARATEPEQRMLRGLLVGDLRQGALEGVVTTAIAQAAGVPVASVRRALMLAGELPAVAAIALRDGAAGLDAVGLEVGRPIQPMLAGTAKSVEDALARVGEAAVEFKVDGARIQVHRDGSDVAIFTRSLDEITPRVPELARAALALPAQRLVLDGEAIALREDGSPYPFQVTASRFGTRGRSPVELTGLFFDLLHLDGEDLLDASGRERTAALDAVVPAAQRVPRGSLEAALAAGHEGVIVKSLEAPYAAGRRGAGWLKVKPVHTLDLVVLAVEHGSGRRRGWLSNLHLGARSDEGFVMLGKTFKGLTDEMLRLQTQRLRELAVSDDGWVVRVRPELVVEIAFDGVQTSTRYPGGVALRFARVLRYRDDKTADQADTIDAVRAFART
jgi:ATP-dependent DNA ligase I